MLSHLAFNIIFFKPCRRNLNQASTRGGRCVARKSWARRRLHWHAFAISDPASYNTNFPGSMIGVDPTCRTIVMTSWDAIARGHSLIMRLRIWAQSEMDHGARMGICMDFDRWSKCFTSPSCHTKTEFWLRHGHSRDSARATDVTICPR